MESGTGERYRRAVEFLYGFVDYERGSRWKYDDNHFDLTRLRGLLRDLGSPHAVGRFIHIAGTNGKGSVAAIIASILMSAGFRTGLYTSPHLVTFRERIRIDGEPISRDDAIDGVDRLRPLVDRYPGITFFDVWTALAFDHFARHNVDISVIEAGLGGRLDSTNVIDPLVSIITPVSMDHSDKLGSTLEAIAGEKAGIIKPGKPVVISPQDPRALAVIEEKASSNTASATLVGRDVSYTIMDDDSFAFQGRLFTLDHLTLPLAGDMQYENAATGIAAIEHLVDSGIQLDVDDIRRGLENVRWPGRLEQIASEPAVILDGAANPGAMRRIVDYLKSRFTRENTIGVTAMCGDKDVGAVLSILHELAGACVFTTVDNDRVLAPEDCAHFAPQGMKTILEPDPMKAVGRAVSMASHDGLVLVTGSLYLVGIIAAETNHLEPDHLMKRKQ